MPYYFRIPTALMSHSPTSDPTCTLLQRIAASDREALAPLYDMHASLLFGILLKMLNSRDEADDVLQDVFLQIWRKAGSFDPAKGKAISWMVVVTRHKAQDFIRKQNRYRTRVQSAAQEQQQEQQRWETVTGSPTREGLYDRERLQAALQIIPEKQREVITLAFLNGLSHSEVAAQLDEPLGTIKSRVRRGLAELHGLLQAGEEPIS